MTSTALPSRRVVLAGAGGVGVAAVLAACGSSDSSSGTAPADDGAASPGEDVASGEDLAAVADVPVGGALSVTVGSAPVLLTRPSEDEVFAYSAICTHQGCTVLPGDGEMRCPCHVSRYDLTTGEVLGGPAPAPLPSIPVTVADGRVVTA